MQVNDRDVKCYEISEEEVILVAGGLGDTSESKIVVEND